MCGASGVAALNVGGRTIHSLFSLSLDLDWQIKEGTILWWMIRNADMIIVDEFSLLSNKLLHTLNDILHKVRRDKRNPFGGITMLLVGDQLQLPAVDLDIFDSALFRNHFVPFVLTEVMRQDDGQFIDLLNRVRIGEETDDDHLTLQQRIAPNNDVSLQDLEDAPMLVGRRNAMHRWNEHFMAQLGSNIVTFNATYVDMGGAPTNQAMCDYINSRNRRVLPQQVFVAAGMRARLIRNVSIQNRLVNSTMVVIKRWSNDVIVLCPIGRTREYPICRFQQIIPVYGPSVQRVGCTITVEQYKVRNPALVPLFVLTAKQKLKWSHLIHSEKWYRFYGQAPYAPAYQTSHPFFCFASHNQKKLKQAEVMENRERTKQHHNFVTLPRANETPILRLSCCHPSGSNSLFETDGERGRERERQREQP